MGESVNEIKQEYVPKKYKVYVTTEDDFETYKSEVNKMLKLFGMGDLAVAFVHTKAKDYKASCTYTIDHRATFALSTVWYTYSQPTPDDIKRVAWHEAAHSLIGRLHIMGASRDFREEEFANELEAYAHRMEGFVEQYETRIALMRELIEKLESRNDTLQAYEDDALSNKLRGE